MNTFIRVAEVWVPSSDGAVLQWAEGIYDAAPDFGAASRTLTFQPGEGLPGRAWQEGRPVLIARLEGSFFCRTAAAQAAGLGSAVAVPVFRAGLLSCVVVMLCGNDETDVGAVELWQNDPRISTDLKLADGYFGSSDESLEALTRDGGFSRGTGVPGLAWQREAAVFIDNIGDSRHFLRAQAAASSGIVRALAFPCSVRGNETWVLSLLSSSRKPVARCVEAWLAGEAPGTMVRAFGHCETRGRLPAGEERAAALDLDTPIGRTFRTGVAQVGRVGSVPGEQSAAPMPEGLQSVLALPVIGEDDAVAEVVVLYF